MKKVIIHILVFLLFLFLSSGAFAANVEGHMQYRVMSYSLNSDDDSSNVNLGTLLITGVTSDILVDDLDNTPDFTSSESKSATDVLAVSADYLATPDLSLYGAFGITKNRWDSAADSEYDASWEANVGVIYRLFNNIRYEVHFGYMETGDLFRESNTYKDVESIIMISNKLTMSF